MTKTPSPEEKPLETPPAETPSLPADSTPSLDPKEAQQLIEADRLKRSNACSQEINTLLEKYNCKLDTRIILSVGSVLPEITVVAN